LGAPRIQREAVEKRLYRLVVLRKSANLCDFVVF